MLHTSAKITTKYRKYKQEIDKSGHLIGNALRNVWRGKTLKQTSLNISFYAIIPCE